MTDPVYEFVKGQGWVPIVAESNHVVEFCHNGKWQNIWTDNRTYPSYQAAQGGLDWHGTPFGYEYRIRRV
jgi:hypothetical protein